MIILWDLYTTISMWFLEFEYLDCTGVEFLNAFIARKSMIPWVLHWGNVWIFVLWNLIFESYRFYENFPFNLGIEFQCEKFSWKINKVLTIILDFN